MEKYDYVVIGSGASGAAVAEKISSDYKVLILEKGQSLSLNQAHKGYVKTSLNKDFEKHGRVAPVEIQTAFDLSATEQQQLMDSLRSKHLISLTPAGNGWFIQRTSNPLVCDPETGLCTI